MEHKVVDKSFEEISNESNGQIKVFGKVKELNEEKLMKDEESCSEADAGSLDEGNMQNI